MNFRVGLLGCGVRVLYSRCLEGCWLEYSSARFSLVGVGHWGACVLLYVRWVIMFLRAGEII